MPKPRKRLVSLDATPYYHCIARCVRRAFLCGQDPHSGFSFEHRRQWIVDRINLLASIFSVDVCAYAVMSNHYHVVLHIDAEQANHWSDREVAKRWLKLENENRTYKHYIVGIPNVLDVAGHRHLPKDVYSWLVNSLPNVASVER